MGWREAIENGERVITLIRIDQITISDASEGIIFKKFITTLGSAVPGANAFGAKPPGGLGASVDSMSSIHKPFNPYLLRSPTHEMDMSGASSFGDFEIAFDENFFDLTGFGQMELVGKKVEMLLGTPTDEVAEYEKVIDTRLEDIRFDARQRRWVCSLSDQGPQLLNRPVQENSYAGTGDIEGDEAIEGDLRPLIIGAGNVSWENQWDPKLIDANKQIYQVNDGPSRFGRVWDSGVELDRTLDFDDIFEFIPDPDIVAIDLSQGLIRLGSVPTGRLTVTGFERAGFGGFGVMLRARDIFIGALRHTGIGTDLLDLDRYERMGNLFEGQFSFESRGLMDVTDKTVLDVLNEITRWHFAFWFFDNLGKLNVIEKINPSWTDGTLPVIEISDEDVIELTSIESIENTPVWRWVVRWDPNFSVLGQSDLAASAQEDPASHALTREFLKRVVAEDETIRDEHPNAASHEEDIGLTPPIAMQLGIYTNSRTPPAERRFEITKDRRVLRFRFILTSRHLFGIKPGDILQSTFSSPTLEGFSEQERMQVSSVRNDKDNKQVSVEAIW